MCTTDYTFFRWHDLHQGLVSPPASLNQNKITMFRFRRKYGCSEVSRFPQPWDRASPRGPLSRSSCDIQQTTQHRLQQRKYYNNNSSAQQWRKKWPSESRVNDEVYDKTWCCVSLLWPLRLLPRHRAKTLLNYSFVRASKGQNTNIILAIK